VDSELIHTVLDAEQPVAGLVLPLLCPPSPWAWPRPPAMVRWVSSRDGYSKVGSGAIQKASFTSTGKSAAAVTTMWVASVSASHEKLQVAQGTHQTLISRHWV